jgi:uncharacterized membrane protein
MNMQLLLATIALRPYVFVFLAIFLLGSTINFGWRTTLLFMVFTYLAALTCEWSSINNGFPFGLYHYAQTTRGHEIWVAGVPLFDSISFAFLGFASYSTALLLAAPLYRRGLDLRLLDTWAVRRSPRVWLLAALFMVMVDTVTDPLSIRGDRWFLGRLFWYDPPGAHFGVPISNYLGWFFLASTTIAIFQLIDGWISRDRAQPRGVAPGIPSRALVGPLLYGGVVTFGITMLFRIGVTEIGWASLLIYLPFLAFALHILTRRECYGGRDAMIRHLANFPYNVPYVVAPAEADLSTLPVGKVERVAARRSR